MKRIIIVGLMLSGVFVHAQEWRTDEYPNSMNFTIENGYYKYEKVDIKDVPQTAITAIQRAKELYNYGEKYKKVYKEDDPQTVIGSLKRVRDLQSNGGWYTWFMNSNYMYMYVCYTFHYKELVKDKDKNIDKLIDKYKDLYYLVTVHR